MLITGLVEEMRRKKVKASWEYHCPSDKGRWPILQYTPYYGPICHKMVLKCLFTYLITRSII